MDFRQRILMSCVANSPRRRVLRPGAGEPGDFLTGNGFLTGKPYEVHEPYAEGLTGRRQCGPHHRAEGVESVDAVLLGGAAGAEYCHQVVAAVAGNPADAVDLPVGLAGIQWQRAVLKRYCHPAGHTAGDAPPLRRRDVLQQVQGVLLGVLAKYATWLDNLADQGALV